jgi:tetraacyldisaccharide 4'-kinase
VRGRLERFARRWWAGDSGLTGLILTALLTPVSWMWALVASLKNRRFDRIDGLAVAGVQVISVGNLAVGGTGKTPVASWVVQTLARQGARPAVLLRGYGTDEALLHARWTPDVPIVVDPDRVNGARRVRELGADTVVLDDGFQHRRLARSVDIVLLAVKDRFPGRMLPTGPYRESARALTRASAVILTRRSAPLDAARALESKVRTLVPGQTQLVVACAHLVSGLVRSLAGDGGPDTFESPLVLTAIARPDFFLEDVARRSRGAAELRAYGDHHDFTADDARDARKRAGQRPIVVTEKDAVKLAPFSSLLGETWVVEQDLEWDWGESDVLELLAAGHSAGTQ